MNARHIYGSKDNLLKVRAAFVAKGTSLSAWCKLNGVVRRTAEQALNGENTSSNARALAHRIQSSVCSK